MGFEDPETSAAGGDSVVGFSSTAVSSAERSLRDCELSDMMPVNLRMFICDLFAPKNHEFFGEVKPERSSVQTSKTTMISMNQLRGHTYIYLFIHAESYMVLVTNPAGYYDQVHTYCPHFR
jgi:hypothetical protein